MSSAAAGRSTAVAPFDLPGLPERHGVPPKPVRRMVFVLGDQLDRRSAAFDDFDPVTDAIFMAEVMAESTHVPSSKIRSALFFSSMRHFAQAAADDGLRVHYTRLDDPAARGSLAEELERAHAALAPTEVAMISPGEWRLHEQFAQHPARPRLLEDRHFLCSRAQFDRHVAGRKQLRMEYFYREMRALHGILMDGEKPVGGKWNFDAENRKAFSASGPQAVPLRQGCPPDAITLEVLTMVECRLSGHPGSLDAFDWPVTRAQALCALGDFVAHRLPCFGDHQDAMWTGEPWLYHAHIASSMNLKLLDPREVIGAAEQAWREGHAPLPAVEGFIRQILGWREFVRGVYWQSMPAYLQANALEATEPLPGFYWTGSTEMACLSQAIGQTLAYGYAHHIQRLMVTGLYALLLGVDPRAVHAWYLSVYVDAVEWVELPNTLGMALYADGGLMASKPYAATGKYIDRMSNYCKDCRFDPAASVGDDACPFTTLYWSFLLRHQSGLAKNPRMSLQLKNLTRLDPGLRARIEARAESIRSGGGTPPQSTMKDLLQ